MNHSGDLRVRPHEADQADEARSLRALLHMRRDLQREQALAREARRNWIDTVDALGDPLMVHDAELRVVRCNRAYAVQAGLPFAEIIGRPYWECFPRRPGPLEACRLPIESGAKGVSETEIQLDTGEVFISRAYAIIGAVGSTNVLHLFENVTEKRRVQQALADSEARYRTMFGQAAVAMLQTSLEGVLLRVNPAFCTMLGYSQSELEGRSFVEFTHPEDKAKSAARIAGLLSGARAPYAVFEKRYLHKLGATIWARVGVSTVRDAAGQPAYFLTIVEDITAGKAAQAALVESEERLREVAEKNRTFIWDVDRDGLYTFANESSTALHGYRVDEIVGKKHFYDLHPEAGREAFKAAALAAFERKSPFVNFENAIQKKDGRVIWVLTNGTPVLDSKGELTGYRGLDVDITDRKAAEKALVESEEKFRAIFSNTVDGIALFDIEARSIRLANQSMARLLGYAAEELEGLPVQCLLPPESAASLIREFDRGAAGESTGASDIPLLRKNGAIVYVDITGAAVQIGAGTYLLGTFRDASERRASEEKLRRTNRALRTLSAGNEALVRASDEAGLLKDMVRVLSEVGGYRSAFIGYAVQDAQKSIETKAVVGFDPGTVRFSWGDNERGQTASARALRLGQTQLVRHIESSAAHAHWRDRLRALGIHAALGLPLRFSSGEPPFGVLGLGAQDEDAFDTEELKLLEELAGDLAYGIANLRAGVERRGATEKLRLSLEGTIAAIGATMESRDPYTAGHQHRVADLAQAIASEMGLPAHTVEGIRFGALVHDLGKIQVPSELLSKPTKLSKLEFELIKAHPQAGYDIIKDVEFPWPIGLMVLQHHERLDGTGYPQGLKGSAIALEARVLAVADVVEAMSSHRPYRPGLGIYAALKEIEQKRGMWFEPAAVDACLRLFREKRFEFVA